VKYRRHLRTARNPAELQGIRNQVEDLHGRWHEWYGLADNCGSFRAIRRAKLARVLRFYADKARRHYLPDEQHTIITSEIERMIEKGGDYSFASAQQADRRWVFCPEYSGDGPLEISPADWETRIFLFGPNLLPDSEFRQEPLAPLPSNFTDGRKERTEPKPDHNTEKPEPDSGMSEPATPHMGQLSLPKRSWSASRPTTHRTSV
jgi:hypothetical protein